MTHGDRLVGAGAFTRGADEYAAVRPGYPAGAIAAAVPAHARDVLDLAAGTGKLTAALAAAVPRVVAVEPSAAMRAELSRSLPDVEVLEGTAEAIPLPDASMDAVTVAQAWHWFDEAVAGREIARVLRPGGTLGVLWNERDESVDWVAAFGAILDAHRTLPRPSDGLPHPGPSFGAVEQTEVAWEHDVPTGDLVRLAGTRSYVLVADDDVRAGVLAQVAELVATHPDLRGRDRAALPYVTRVLTAVRA